MIPIAAATQPGTRVSGSADVASAGTVSSGTGASSFLARFTQALSTQGAVKGGKAESLIASLIDAVGQVAPQTSSGGKGESKSDSVSSQDPAGSALLQSLLIPAIVAMAGDTTSKPASVDAGHADESAAMAQTGGKGKKLPNLLASIAGQKRGGSNQDQSTTQARGASDAPSQTLSRFLSQASSQSLPQSSSHAADQSKQAVKLVQVLTAGTGASALASTTQSDQSHTQNPSLTSADTSASSLAVPVAVHATTQHAATASTPSSNLMNMHSSFGSSNWAQELGDKMIWMAGKQGHTSELVLNPPSLGTVEVRLHVNGADAGARFFAANVDVRNAIEAAMPKLREMMAGAGLVLGEAMVSNQSFSQRESSQRQPQNMSSGGGRPYGSRGVIGVVSALGSGPSALRPIGPGSSLLDYYA